MIEMLFILGLGLVIIGTIGILETMLTEEIKDKLNDLF